MNGFHFLDLLESNGSRHTSYWYLKMSKAILDAPTELRYVQYHSSKEKTYLSAIRQLISDDLSEPYSIYVYRYFLYQWGDLCFMVSRIVKGCLQYLIQRTGFG